MLDERDLSLEKKWLWAEQAELTVANFKRRHINAQYTPSKDDALPLVLSMIPEGATVVRGDSVSLDPIGIIPALAGRNRNTVVDPFARDSNGNLLARGAKRGRMLRRAFNADVFLTGTNAVTLDGKLVSTDALGNRVAAMIFGPSKVIVVAGINKLVKDVDEATARIHNIATSVNERHV